METQPTFVTGLDLNDPIVFQQIVEQIPKKLKLKYTQPPEAIMMQLSKQSLKNMQNVFTEKEEGLDLS